MAFKEKIHGFATKYGFNIRGLVIATLVFPPAGLYIAWKMPNFSLPARLGLAAGALALPGLIPLVIGGPILYLASWASEHFN